MKKKICLMMMQETPLIRSILMTWHSLVSYVNSFILESKHFTKTLNFFFRFRYTKASRNSDDPFFFIESKRIIERVFIGYKAVRSRVYCLTTSHPWPGRPRPYIYVYICCLSYISRESKLRNEGVVNYPFTPALTWCYF